MKPSDGKKSTALKRSRKRPLFPEDTSSDSDSGGNTTLSYSEKISTKKLQVFKFRKFPCECEKKEKSPSSSPLNWPPSPIIISSHEELERSMIEMEMAISLEMDSD